MIRPLDLTDPATLRDLVALQRAAYAVEAGLLGTTAIPALQETEAELAASGETFLGAERDGRLVGAVSFKRDDDVLDIHRLVVHPGSFRQGIAAALLDALPPAPEYVVSTGAANTPARALYEKWGFRAVQEREVGDGVRIIEFALRSDFP